MKNTVVIITVFFIISCHGWKVGRVVDDKTGEPVEGAIVYIDWNLTKGLPGLTYTEDYKIVEVATDSRGKFVIPGILNPFPHILNITAYKKGYVAWNNRLVFPKDIYSGYENGKGWPDDSVIRLKEFRPDYEHYGHRYTHEEHTRFISSVTEDSIEIRKAVEWEEKKAREEDVKIQINFDGWIVDAESGKPVEEAIGLTVRGGCNSIMLVTSCKDGKISITGEFQLVNPPSLVIYKKGYVAWLSNINFLPLRFSRSPRTDFVWQNDYIFRLERWKPHYSHEEHYNLITGYSINGISYSYCDKDKSAHAKAVVKKFHEAIIWEKGEE